MNQNEWKIQKIAIPCDWRDIPLTSLDLREEAIAAHASGDPYEMAVISLVDATGYILSDNMGEALYLPEAGRIGIAQGAEADWADTDSIEDGIRMYMADFEAFKARN